MEVVAPLVADVPHSAALLGWGSDVVGFDTERSTDHGWGPRLQLFVADDDVADLRSRIDRGLPDEFRGWPTRFGWDEVPVTDHVTVTTVGAWLERQLGFDPRRGVTTVDWLATPQQLLLEVTGGRRLPRRPRRARAGAGACSPGTPTTSGAGSSGCQWWRIEHEESFMGRTAEVGDELGSRVGGRTARARRDAALLPLRAPLRAVLEVVWDRRSHDSRAPGDVGPGLERLLAARDFARARGGVGVGGSRRSRARHNALRLTDSLDPTVRPFYSRPFRVIEAPRFAAATIETVSRSVPPLAPANGLDRSDRGLDRRAQPRRRRAAVRGDLRPDDVDVRLERPEAIGDRAGADGHASTLAEHPRRSMQAGG